MHKLQKLILKRLLVENGQKYSTLTQGYNFEDNVVFHLKQLITSGFIEKKNERYFITTQGTKEITNYDLGTLEDTGFKTFFLGFLCNIDGKYLLKEHLAANQTFYNLPSGKPRFGENIKEALVRTFSELIGLELSSKYFKYLSLHLKTVKTLEGEVLFDDAFAIYEVEIDLVLKEKMKLDKKIKMFSKDEIKKLKNIWPEVDYLILKNDKSNYKSYEFVSDYIL